MHPKERDENAKDPAWQTPVDLPSVSPEDYRNTSAGGGTTAGADDQPKEEKPRFHAGLSDPAGKELKTVSEAARKLATQTGRSG